MDECCEWLCCRHASLTLQQALNATDQSWPSKDARALLFATRDERRLQAQDSASTGVLIIEHLNKPLQGDTCIRTMTHLPEVNCYTTVVSLLLILLSRP